MSPRETSISFAGAGAGALGASLFLASALHEFGARVMFSLLLLLSAGGTAVLPLAAPMGIFAIFPLRVIQGIAVAAFMPMIGFVSAHWAPVTEMGWYLIRKWSENSR